MYFLFISHIVNSSRTLHYIILIFELFLWQSSFDKQSIISLVIWVCSVLYSCVRTASSSSKLTMSEHILAKEGAAGKYTLLIKIKSLLISKFEMKVCPIIKSMCIVITYECVARYN